MSNNEPAADELRDYLAEELRERVRAGADVRELEERLRRVNEMLAELDEPSES
ncbi:hypothetical protein Ade02nite_42290 [Paractinoplanes deccanensis]|uniref:Uncharacterized protein n=1 Tax=Paractinoplanes deccanensis TaxID=113561 RepID=A0ABQ3Y6J1_9ACTN|nr:hypothetical protein [Actinoplanes deccanensis]GID75588.1 hypothetical protein Ade02nite_42290 [Actinoplanes deccanensis]